MKTEVVVVGGGPVGLMVAGELALAGVQVTVLERRTQRVKQSRAFTIHSRSIEVLEMRGIAGQCLSEGLPVPTGHYGTLETRLDFSILESRFPYTLFLPQERLERILEQRALEVGVDIRRGHQVETIEQQGELVRINASGREGNVEILCSYAIGADGARSVVRNQCGIDFPGTNSKSTFYFGDVILKNPLAPGFFAVRNENGGVYAAPIGNGLHRTILLDPKRFHVPASETVTIEEMIEGTRRIIGRDIGISDPLWMSRVGDETRLVSCYRKKRVFLAGDAAHVHMPAGGQGLNVGLQDAMNLGWKLAAVVRQMAPESILDTYDQERRPVGESLIENTLAQTFLMTAFERDGFAMRATMNQLLLQPSVNRKLAEDLAAFSVVYPTPILPTLSVNEEWTGRRVPDTDLQLSNGASVTLYSLLREGKWIDLRLESNAPSQIPVGLDLRCTTLVDAVIVEPNSRLCGLRGVLIRPDGHVASSITKDSPPNAIVQPGR